MGCLVCAVNKKVQNKIKNYVFALTNKESRPSIITGGKMTGKSYSVREAAAILSMAPQTIQRYCRQEQIPCFKLGVRYRITEETIDGIKNGTIEIRQNNKKG
jgi:excisionase family DNA binding protein